LPITHIHVTLIQYYPLNFLTIGYNLLITVMYYRFRSNFAFQKCNCNAFLITFVVVLIFVFVVVVVVVSLSLCLCVRPLG
jgi:hypothetical protein